ncbi:response regulator [bacterium]|nr:response regulator [candidate division CSSED10-310 bacterium]
MAKGTILLLEQNPKITRIVETAASRGGYKFYALPWGEDIIDYLKENDVDIILMNIRQIGLGARTICAKIREQPKFSRFPLIILYGKSEKEKRLDFLKLGADDFLPMPFTPIDMIILINSRLRPIRDKLGTGTALTKLDAQFQIELEKVRSAPFASKGELEEIPLTTIFSRLFFERQSGVLNLIIKKETHSIFLENGNIVFAESFSKKEDLGDFMARNGAGKGTGKDIIAARNQAGGPGCDPREFRIVLLETDLMDNQTFAWWQNMYIVEHIADMFPKLLGTYQWQDLPLPDYVKDLTFDPIYTPHMIFEGLRRMEKWWSSRQKLPEESSIPRLTTRFYELASDYGLSRREITLLKVIDGKRSLKDIREICHRFAQNIDNYIFACRELHFVSFEKSQTDESVSETDIHMEITEAMETEESPTEEVKVVIQKAPVESKPEPVPVPKPEPELELETQSSEPVETAAETPSVEPEPEEQELDPFGTTTQLPILDLPEGSIKPEDSKSIAEKSGEDEKLESGELKDISVAELIGHCIQTKFSGSLEVSNRIVTKKIFWKRGKIVTASSDDIDERFDNFLYRKHLITFEQKEALIWSAGSAAGSPNEILKRHLLDIEQMFRLVKEQVELILVDIFNWFDGTFALHEKESPPRDAIPMDVSAEAVIVRGLHQLKNWEYFEDKLPKDGELVKLADQSRKSKMGLNLSSLELRIMNVLTEPLPVEEIIRRVTGNEEYVRQSLFAMEVIGLITCSGRRKIMS